MEQFSSHVTVSEQPVVIADVQGRILLANEAFKTLVAQPEGTLRHLRDLADAFTLPDEFHWNVGQLLDTRRSWRGEVELRRDGDRGQMLMVRADPVQPARDRVLGFVLIFSDLTDRKAADAARSRFQDGIVQSHRTTSAKLDRKADVAYQSVMSLVLENAQLAALEITYGVEPGRIAEMLEGVRNSTLRTAEVLEHLIRHASRTGGGGDDI